MIDAGHTKDLLTNTSLHRRAQLFVRALWGRALATYQAPVTESIWDGPYLDSNSLYLPRCWDNQGRDNQARASSLYRAAAAHAVAHQVYGRNAIALTELKPRQRVIIGLLEDIRVETLACREFPGLRRLWLQLHDSDAGKPPMFPDLIQRLSLCLLEDNPAEQDAWIRKGVGLFNSDSNDLTEPQCALEIGLCLAHDIGQMRISMNLHRPVYSAPYRDDNRHLWLDNQNTENKDNQEPGHSEVVSRNSVFQVEREISRQMDIAQQPLTGDTHSGLFVKDEFNLPVLEYRRREDSTMIDTWRYPEWHYQLARVRHNWCTLHQIMPKSLHLDRARHILSENRLLVRRLRYIARSMRLSQRQRLRRQYEGDALDLDATIDNMLDYHAGLAPNYRFYESVHQLAQHSLASLLLMDLSESVNDPLNDNHTVLDITRSAALILTQIMGAQNEPFAVHGFHSRGRHDVRYFEFKDFPDKLDDRILGRIAAAEAANSTRLGTALRHATAQLLLQPQQHKILLLLTDGIPSDIDSHDPEYLPADTVHAVRSARLSGVQVFCLSMDRNADHYIAHLFGRRYYRVVDHIERLPQVLPAMFLSLYRRYG